MFEPEKSLVNAIQFRSLLSQLTPTECHQFVKDPTIIKVLFLTIAQFDEVGDTINKSISKIINSRKQKIETETDLDSINNNDDPEQQLSTPTTTKNTIKVKLDTLPNEMIGYTASFLSQSEYVNLSITNRALFISCNSPNLMHELDLRKISEISEFPFAKFLNSKHLKIKSSHFNPAYFDFNIRIKNKWEYVTFNIDSQPKYLIFGVSLFKPDLFYFVKQQSFNFNHVKYLALESIRYFTRCRTGMDDFVCLLSKFPKLEYLYFNAPRWRFGVNMLQRLKRVCPLLKGVAGDNNIIGVSNLGRDILPQLLKTFDLQHLSLTFSYQYRCCCHLQCCEKLEELVLYRQSPRIIQNMIESSRNLKKIYIGGIHYNSKRATELRWTDIMKHVINHCKCLEYIEISNNGRFIESMLSGIQVGLDDTKLLKRNRFKITMDAREANDGGLGQRFIPNTVKIANLLEVSNIDDFMFIWCLNDKVDKYQFVYQLQDNLSEDIEIRIDEFRVVIMNKKCKINGYAELWKI